MINQTKLRNNLRTSLRHLISLTKRKYNDITICHVSLYVSFNQKQKNLHSWFLLECGSWSFISDSLISL